MRSPGCREKSHVTGKMEASLPFLKKGNVPGKLWASKPHLCAWEDCEANASRSYAKASARQDGNM